MLFLLFEVGLFLALVTQLRHIGFVAFFFFSGVLTGLWRRDLRLLAVSSTTSLIFVTTYLACWVQMDARFLNYRPYLYSDAAMQAVHKSISNYVAEHRSLPNSIAELKPYGLQLDASNQYLDGWGGPIQYERKETFAGFQLRSLGRDHQLGGVGLDADIIFGQQRSIPRLPLNQFLFETDGRAGVFVAAIAASLLAGCLFWEFPNRTLSKRRQIVRVSVTFIFAMIVAMFLAALHVSNFQSGH